jgi:hypothetical protein
MLNLHGLYGESPDFAPFTKFDSVVTHFRMKFRVRRTTRLHLTDARIGVA